MQTQAEPRIRKRLACTLNVEARQHNGLILNLSQRGLFVQTTLPAEPGTLLALDVRDPVRGEAIPLQAAVVWRRRVSPRMTGTNQSGMGLRLIERPDAWTTMLSSLLATDAPGEARAADTAAATPAPARPAGATPTEAPASPATGADARPVFCVRLAQAGGPRSRRMRVQGQDEIDAGKEALREAGEGWTVLEVWRA